LLSSIIKKTAKKFLLFREETIKVSNKNPKRFVVAQKGINTKPKIP